MITRMSDLERVDRELEALGPVPAKLSELLARYGLRDRSLENVDEALSGLGNGHEDERLPTETLVDRPSFLPLGWDQKEDVPPAEAVAPALELRDEITVTSPAPEPDELPPMPATEAQPPVREPTVFATAPEPELPGPSTVEPAFEPQATFALPTPEPATFAASSSSAEPDAASAPESIPFAPARSHRPSRPDLQALLDEELDPREFPSSHPPATMRSSRSTMTTPMPMPSLPPVPRSSLLPQAGNAQSNVQPEAEDADFELLVDDDDILEIDE